MYIFLLTGLHILYFIYFIFDLLDFGFGFCLFLGFPWKYFIASTADILGLLLQFQFLRDSLVSGARTALHMRRV